MRLSIIVLLSFLTTLVCVSSSEEVKYESDSSHPGPINHLHGGPGNHGRHKECLIPPCPGEHGHFSGEILEGIAQKVELFRKKSLRGEEQEERRKLRGDYENNRREQDPHHDPHLDHPPPQHGHGPPPPYPSGHHSPPIPKPSTINVKPKGPPPFGDWFTKFFSDHHGSPPPPPPPPPGGPGGGQHGPVPGDINHNWGRERPPMPPNRKPPNDFPTPKRSNGGDNWTEHDEKPNPNQRNMEPSKMAHPPQPFVGMPGPIIPNPKKGPPDDFPGLRGNHNDKRRGIGVPGPPESIPHGPPYDFPHHSTHTENSRGNVINPGPPEPGHRGPPNDFPSAARGRQAKPGWLPPTRQGPQIHH